MIESITILIIAGSMFIYDKIYNKRDRNLIAWIFTGIASVNLAIVLATGHNALGN